jgi:GntR family transcriptional regulator of gluconate operon
LDPRLDPLEDRLRPLATPRSLADEAADVIREQILAGKFQRGQHLVEARIARELNVSRGPVRDAFKLLRSEGLVADEPRRGTFVVTLTAKDVSDIYELRAALEWSAARTVAAHRSDVEVAELSAVLDQMSDAVTARDVQQVGLADLAFHEALCRLSGNARIHAVFAQTVPALRTLLLVDQHLYSGREIADQHRPILEAISAGDANLAAALVESHVRRAREQVLAFLESTLGQGIVDG